MSRIPKWLLAEILADKWYTRCCISGDETSRADPIEFHHNLIFGGRQVQARFAILPLKRSLHARATDKQLKRRLDWIMLSRASPEELAAISKATNYARELTVLEGEFGKFKS